MSTATRHAHGTSWPKAGQRLATRRLPRRPLTGNNLGMTLRTTVSMPAEVKYIQAEHRHMAAERRYTQDVRIPDFPLRHEAGMRTFECYSNKHSNVEYECLKSTHSNAYSNAY